MSFVRALMQSQAKCLTRHPNTYTNTNVNPTFKLIYFTNNQTRTNNLNDPHNKNNNLSSVRRGRLFRGGFEAQRFLLFMCALLCQATPHGPSSPRHRACKYSLICCTSGFAFGEPYLSVTIPEGREQYHILFCVLLHSKQPICFMLAWWSIVLFPVCLYNYDSCCVSTGIVNKWNWDWCTRAKAWLNMAHFGTSTIISQTLIGENVMRENTLPIV